MLAIIGCSRSRQSFAVNRPAWNDGSHALPLRHLASQGAPEARPLVKLPVCPARGLAGMIELRQLLYALAAADQCSFARAASQFRMKQSTLSRKVMRLEDELGFALFDRTTRGARPTAKARPFLEDARRLVDQATRLELRARALQSGCRAHMALGYSGALFRSRISDLLQAFISDHPDIVFDGVEREPEELLESLARRDVDAVIVPAGCGEAKFASMPLWKESLRACFGTGHRLSALPVLRWADLASEHLVVTRAGAGPVLLDLVRKQCAGSPDPPHITIQDASNDTICRVIALGSMVFIEGTSAFGKCVSGLTLRTIEANGADASLGYVLYWHRDNDNPVFRRFRAMLANETPAITA